MNDFALLILFIVPSLFAIAFTIRRYRTATALQRRQILIAAAGAVVLTVGMCCFYAFR